MNNEIFSKSLQNLDKILKDLKSINVEVKRLDTPLAKTEKTFSKFEKTTERLSKNFQKLVRGAKTLSLLSIGASVFSGFKGLTQNQINAQSRALGVTSRERNALQFAGKQSGFGDDFFTGMLKNLREVITTQEGAGALTGGLGIDIYKAREMNQVELLKQVISGIQNSSLAQENLSPITQQLLGLSLNELKAIDFKAFVDDLNKAKDYTTESTPAMREMGKSFAKLQATLERILNSFLNDIAPYVQKIFDYLTNTLPKIYQDFKKEVMEGINFVTSPSEWFSSKKEEGKNALDRDLDNLKGYADFWKNFTFEQGVQNLKNGWNEVTGFFGGGDKKVQVEIQVKGNGIVDSQNLTKTINLSRGH